jgi:hypothetical protein
MNSRRALLLFAVLLPFSGCDCLGCGGGEERGTVDGGRDLGPSLPEPAELSLTPAQATGTVPGDEGTRTLAWTHRFDANSIVSAAACGGWFYTATASGRLVRYDLKTMSLEQTVSTVHSVTSVNAVSGELIVGTEHGRLIHADCRLTRPKETPETLYPVRYAQLDPRSRHDKRAFVIFQRTPGHETESDHDPIDADTLVAAHLDLGTGRAISDPFEVARPSDAGPLGFVDYRGDFWMGLSADRGASPIWSLKRFGDPPSVEGLEDAPRLNGFAQVGREVWAYFGSRQTGYVVRVDTNRARTLWNGEKFKTGEHAGGDVPKNQPVTLVIPRGERLVVLTPDAVYDTDIEMRRWKKRGPSSPTPLFNDVRGWGERGDGFLIATADGLVLIDDEGWKKQVVPTPVDPDERTPPVREVEWAESTLIGSDDGLVSTSESGDPVEVDLDEPVFGMLIDELDRLWIVTAEALYVARQGSEGPEMTRWELDPTGLHAERIVSLRTTRDGLAIQTDDGAQWDLDLQ